VAEARRDVVLDHLSVLAVSRRIDLGLDDAVQPEFERAAERERLAVRLAGLDPLAQLVQLLLHLFLCVAVHHLADRAGRVRRIADDDGADPTAVALALVDRAFPAAPTFLGFSHGSVSVCGIIVSSAAPAGIDYLPAGRQ